VEGALRALLHRGCGVAVAVGVGLPSDVLAPLSAAARAVGDVELVLGWVPGSLEGLEWDAFRTVRTVMGGYSLRSAVDDGRARYVPARLGAVPALLAVALRPDVVIASVVSTADGYRCGTEVGWTRAALASGALLAAVERPALPALEVGPPLPADRMTIIGASDAPAATVTWAHPTDELRALAAHAVGLIPEGARLQYGPGPVGTAVLDALEVPVAIDTGMITDPVMHLERRGLLLGSAVGPYVAGTAEHYAWCPGHVGLSAVEVTHDPIRLSSDPPLIAVNTALEIDLDGQVNVESVKGSSIAGVGGQPDYAGAAARSITGLSVVAVPTHRGGHRTLVERLAAPVSTPSHDVEVVVTERGVADLRGLDRRERRAALEALWV
jgi:acyl-CoA hydrolase